MLQARFGLYNGSGFERRSISWIPHHPYMIKTELLADMRAGHDAWQALIAQLDRACMLEPGVEGDWSVKDVIAHVSTYEDWMAQLLEAGGPNIPHMTDTMSQDETNAWVFEQNRDRSLDDVLALSHRSFDRLARAVEALSPEDLVSTGKFEWARGKPVYTLIPGESYNHYLHHAPSLAAWLERTPGNDKTRLADDGR